VYLCYRHHNGSDAGAHFNKSLDEKLKQECQRAFELKIGNKKEFINIFGRNYLD